MSNVFEEQPKQQPPYEGAYPPPNRVCYVCSGRVWVWDGERYQCGSREGTAIHREYAAWLQRHFQMRGV
jgi:hypothetical protein